MIVYTKKLEQDFLGPEFINELKDLGVNVNDGKYCIIKHDGNSYIFDKSKVCIPFSDKEFYEITPTYTLSELLYKIPEYLPEKGMTNFWKDAPFYCFQCGKNGMFTCDEYPIISAARFLILCAKNEEYKKYISNDISNK